VLIDRQWTLRRGRSEFHATQNRRQPSDDPSVGVGA
jgi:hypothetical protein